MATHAGLCSACWSTRLLLSSYCLSVCMCAAKVRTRTRKRHIHVKTITKTTPSTTPPFNWYLDDKVMQWCLHAWPASHQPFTWVSYSAMISLSFLTLAWDDILERADCAILSQPELAPQLPQSCAASPQRRPAITGDASEQLQQSSFRLGCGPKARRSCVLDHSSSALLLQPFTSDAHFLQSEEKAASAPTQPDLLFPSSASCSWTRGRSGWMDVEANGRLDPLPQWPPHNSSVWTWREIIVNSSREGCIQVCIQNWWCMDGFGTCWCFLCENEALFVYGLTKIHAAELWQPVKLLFVPNTDNFECNICPKMLIDSLEKYLWGFITSFHYDSDISH